MRQYRLKNQEAGPIASLLFEIKIDLQDIRSGYRSSDWGLYLNAPWIDDQDLEWTADMVAPVDCGNLEEIAAQKYVPWPDLADQKMIHYLARYYRPKAWRNTRLGLFSSAWETAADFTARCREALRDLLERDLKKVREVFHHRMVEMERRLTEQVDRESPSETWRERQRVRVHKLFNDLREQLSCLLLDATRPVGDLPALPIPPELGADSKARFDAFTREFISAYNEVLQEYEFQASQIEPYDVPLAYSHIEIVSRGILWLEAPTRRDASLS